MTGDGQGELGLGDTASVIADAQPPHAAGFYFHLDARCPRIQRIFHQLLEHGRGPLHHFPGGNLVSELRR